MGPNQISFVTHEVNYHEGINPMVRRYTVMGKWGEHSRKNLLSKCGRLKIEGDTENEKEFHSLEFGGQEKKTGMQKYDM